MTKRPIIKVCGLKEQIEKIAELPVDLFGLIFVKESPRYLRTLSAGALVATKGKAVGVFRNPTLDEIEDTVSRFALAAIQLHGEETQEICLTLRKLYPHLKIIKALSIPRDLDIAETFSEEEIDLLLLDSGNGGSGMRFDWGILNSLSLKVPYLLAGGIDLSCAKTLSQLIQSDTQLLGFDLNSGFEVRPGLKDPGLVRTFIEEFHR